MKKHILTVVQLLITAGLLWWIFRNPDQNQKLLVALDSANLWWFFPGLVAIGAGLLIQVERWRILLRVQGIVVSFSRAIRIILVGMFFNLFLIGATGGDIVKIFLIIREAPHKKAGALLSVFIDRIVGLLALAAISAAMILFHWDELISHDFTRLVVFTVAIILGGSLAFILVAWLVDRLHLTARLPQWLPARAKIAEAATAFAEYARAGKSVTHAFLLSIPSHFLFFSTFYFGAKAFNSGLELSNLFCVSPIVSTVTALPISVGGAGLREALFIKILGGLYSTPESIATLISLSGFMMSVFWSLVGGAIYLLYRSTSHDLPHMADMQGAVETLEHQVEAKAVSGHKLDT
jgi:uncharacterized protein (TIRG00374 family)